MNHTVATTVAYVEELKKLLADFKGVEVIISPPFTALYSAKKALGESNICVSAQNMHQEYKGAYTGEISPVMLKEIGCTYVILGHSERRQYFGETNDKINLKVKLAFEHGLLPIICVGETLEQREAKITKEVIGKQIKECLNNLNKEQLEFLVVAYEPIWAIGTGKTASDKDAQEVNGFIRDLLKELFGEDSAEKVRILYGGSVKAENIVGLMAMPDVDGALVGGACLKADSFFDIIKALL